MTSCPSGHYSIGTDRKFALLENVFKKFPEIPVSIEIKEDNEQLIQKVQYTTDKSITDMIIPEFPIRYEQIIANGKSDAPKSFQKVISDLDIQALCTLFTIQQEL